jgi:hypothetical protein
MDIRLKDSRIEQEEGHWLAVFDLSMPPGSSWIVSFEECLAKHSRVGVVVFGRTIRLDLHEPEREEFARLRGLVQRCIHEANVATA